MSDAALLRRYEAAQAMARDASALAQRLAPPPGAPDATTKSAQDWLTEADGAVETLLRDRVAALFPDDGFLGEESGHGGGGGALRWVVDPIDGTSNYARGRPRWCVSIGVMEGDAPLLGVLAAPGLGEVHRACRGHGAFLNDQRLRPSGTGDPTRAMVELSWSPRIAAARWTAAMARLLDGGAMPRTEGSGALGLADVANGRLDGFVELHIHLWDVAGALALLAEARVPCRRGALPGPLLAGDAALLPLLGHIAGAMPGTERGRDDRGRTERDGADQRSVNRRAEGGRKP